MNKYHLILLIVLVLIVVLLVLRTSHFTLYNGDEWESYRLGDAVSYTEDVSYHIEKFPNSIASTFIQRNKPHKLDNFDLLKQIINERRTTIHRVLDDTLILHIRVGDVLCIPTSYEDGPRHYAKKGDVEWWENVIHYIKAHGINNVMILAGAHKNMCLDESSNYIKDRSQFLKDGTGVAIDYRIGQPPDDDVMYCSRAKHIMTTGGSFGNVLIKVSQM